MPRGKKRKVHKSSRISLYLIRAGLVLIITSAVLFFYIFYPVIFSELSYDLTPRPGSTIQSAAHEIKPADENFGIVIPKIGANSRVIADVNPFDSSQYQQALTRGVAHAKGSDYPDGTGNVFLFAHSSDNWYHANRYNSIFYLLYKLEKSDEIDVYYRGHKYIYRVTEKKTADANDTKYLNPYFSANRLTLMTCWPPGTDMERMIVLAEKQ